MTKKLSFLALFVATVMLCAAPAAKPAPSLSAKNAYLPDATMVVTLNAQKLNNSFLGDLCDHDLIGTFCSATDLDVDFSDPIMAQVKSQFEKANITVVSALTPADFESNVPPVKKFMVCCELKEALGPLVDVIIQKAIAQETDEFTATAIRINGCKGVKIVDKEGLTMALVFDGNGRYVFLGAPEILKSQLTEEAAAKAPARLLAAKANALDGAFLNAGIVMTDEFKAMAAASAGPEFAGFISTIDSFLFSASTSGNIINLQLGANFITAEVADAIKSMLDSEVIPQVKAMAPALANGADVSFVNTLACTQKGSLVKLACSLSESDIMTIGQVISAAYSGSGDSDDYDFEDDEDGIEFEDVY